ncbi:glycerate kinase [Campylobacter geochelonis]|uniref:Glycerate kinase 1 n=1 Tax=Campylobacter geochelonis TaxID=1780362 RepID=A0A128EEP7_9BACT|nr:glycerate kinase [Campylobacter geochelonis]QKF72106.1 glycerate kinase [Campylobacter geochelonis]CZE45910.1 glycerate kinase 1 [Campylobacter geochelonis]CZE46718.1 glycerate kinase 1 [Campylobacter geochelonis]
MKVVIAIDSFKGCLSSLEAGNAIKNAIASLVDEVIVVPIADGGEGSVEAMISAIKAKKREVLSLDPLGRELKTNYAYVDNQAIMEMASSCGLTLLDENERNPEQTSTYGLGLMIKDALKLGVRKFIIGIGGSATNDAGMGMLKALGFEFYDEFKNPLAPKGKNLAKIASISDLNALKELKECEFLVACDVNNPLFGKSGAAHIYGVQKGADSAMIERLDMGLRNFSKITSEFFGVDNSNLAGSGAAGGLGFGLVSFLGAKLQPGFEIISNVVGLKDKLVGADLVITGEGRLDYQSIMGKTPSAVAKLAKTNANVTVIALAGAISDGAKSCNECIDAYFCIQQGAISLAKALKPEVAKANLSAVSLQALRLFLASKSAKDSHH